jgi:hypothetical protein
MPTSLVDVPLEILLDSLLPLLPVTDLLSLTQVSKVVYRLCPSKDEDLTRVLPLVLFDLVLR